MRILRLILGAFLFLSIISGCTDIKNDKTNNKDSTNVVPQKGIINASPYDLINDFKRNGAITYTVNGIFPDDELFKYTKGKKKHNIKKIDITDEPEDDIIVQIYNEEKSSWANSYFLRLPGNQWVFAGYTDYMYQNSSPKFRVVKTNNKRWLVIKYLDLYPFNKQAGYWETWYRIDNYKLVEEKINLIKAVKIKK